MPTSQGKLNSKATKYNNLIPILICLALAILTVVAFWSLKDGGFISFDDQMYVYENADVQSGLNGNSITQAFSSELAEKSGNWHPVTWLSLMLDYQIFGLNPQGFHLMNLLFHVMNTLLLFLILRRMTKALWPSAFVAALFAIHPLHVESVAWIAERKDVLSTFFWMLTMGAYSYYVDHPGFRRYFFVILFFILGLMAKPMLVTLPFALLLLDFWPLQRLQKIKPADPESRDLQSPGTSRGSRRRTREVALLKGAFGSCNLKVIFDRRGLHYKWSLIYPLLWEKVPLFVLTVLSSIVTYVVQQQVGSVSSIEALPLGVRIWNAFIFYVAYIGKMIWPGNLAIYYPYPRLLVPWEVFVSVFFLITITLIVIWRAKRSPYLVTGWLWYIGTLVPVIGIVQVGSQAMADRYTYIPLIGLFIIMAWGVPDLLEKWNHRKKILLTLSALIILCLSIVTWTQAGYWQNSITLFDHTLKVTDYNWFIYNCRGSVYNNLGNYSQAIEDYDRAIQIRPDYLDAHNNRCSAYNGLGNYKQAVEDCGKAIEIKPAYAMAYNNRGAAYNGLGNYRQAIEDYSKAIEIKPAYAMAYNNRGAAYNGLGNYRQAIEDYSRAIEIKPGYAEAHNNRGNAYNGLGNYQQAIDDLKRAIEIKPFYAEAYYNKGNAYKGLGNYKQAIEDYGRVIGIKPGYVAAYVNRGLVYINQGDKISGCRDAQKACELGNCKLLEVAKTRGLCR